MIDYHQFCQIKDLHHTHGLKVAQIADSNSNFAFAVAARLRRQANFA